MKKKTLFLILGICLVIIITTVTLVLIPLGKKIKYSNEEKAREKEIREATVIVELQDNLDVTFNSKVKISELISNINGEIQNDTYINTTNIGEQEVFFEYINDENIKIPYSYKINVVDKTPPVVWLNSSYTVNTNYKGSLTEDILCGDDYDNKPKCEIIGKYDTSKVGKYDLVFKATDSSNNITEKKFVLNVTSPSSGSGGGSYTQTNIKDIIAKHKNEQNKIGIDVSEWQGEIDYDAVKNAGIEFVFIRVGGTKGIDGAYFLDKRFQRNIEGFNKVGIPVGIYFYSYAKTSEAARQDALWILDQIKDYKIDLPIAYDWENWSFYNTFELSFYNLTNNAKVFLDTFKDAGYDGVLYGSLNYIKKVWLDIDYPIWLAHYVSTSSDITYQGQYKYWQLCSNGKVPGIKGNVDVDILYEE